MAQYTLKDVQVSDFRDPHGNSWLNVAFEEFGEPVALVVKDPSKFSVGYKLDGEIKAVTGKSGKTYNRFFRDKPQDFNGGQASGEKKYQPGDGNWKKKEFVPRDDHAIQAQWAIGQANLQVVNGLVEPQAVEELAKDFYAMIDRVKAGEVKEQTAVPTSDLPF